MCEQTDIYINKKLQVVTNFDDAVCIDDPDAVHAAMPLRIVVITKLDTMQENIVVAEEHYNKLLQLTRKNWRSWATISCIVARFASRLDLQEYLQYCLQCNYSVKIYNDR